MSMSQWAGRLYSLDTLDTRFTSSAKTPNSRIDPATSLPNETRGGRNEQQAIAEEANPPKWKSVEFAVYGFVFLTVIPLMFWTAYDVSRPSHPNYPSFDHLLSQGWIPRRKVDNSDLQYSGFRDNVPYLFIVLVTHPLLRRFFNSVYTVPGSVSEATSLQRQNGNGSPFSSQKNAAGGRLEQRIGFDLFFGLTFLIALHGVSAAKVLIILYINYNLATNLKREYVPAATWVFNVGILFANELSEGYRMARIAHAVLPSNNNEWATSLDSYGGLVPRWEVMFNFTVLRLISFNFDYIWSLDQSGSSALEKQLDPANLSERDRISISASPAAYSFRHYIAYALYSPLFLAGPILTFNDYIAQSRYPPSTVSLPRTALYGIRFLIALLSMEVMIHFIYVVAISKSSPQWDTYTPFQLSMLGYFNLQHIWLKLLLPFRFFRWWALVDGIDPPENVVRCMSNNYSVFAFWRGWHRSFNRWLIRYIYIPMGGSGGPSTAGSSSATKRDAAYGVASKYWTTARAIANTLTIFTFVAIWHDIQLRLLVWGWLITLFVLPELVATLLFPARRWKHRPEMYRVICGIGAVFNILMMMSANLVGFALGLDGLKGIVLGIGGTWAGIGFLVAACGALFTGAQVMFELREEEKRDGVVMKC